MQPRHAVAQTHLEGGVAEDLAARQVLVPDA